MRYAGCKLVQYRIMITAKVPGANKNRGQCTGTGRGETLTLAPMCRHHGQVLTAAAELPQAAGGAKSVDSAGIEPATLCCNGMILQSTRLGLDERQSTTDLTAQFCTFGAVSCVI